MTHQLEPEWPVVPTIITDVNLPGLWRGDPHRALSRRGGRLAHPGHRGAVDPGGTPLHGRPNALRLPRAGRPGVLPVLRRAGRDRQRLFADPRNLGIHTVAGDPNPLSG